MEHSFSIEHAKSYGVNCAVVLKNLQFWIQKNLANRKHFYEGRVWTYNSVKAFKELFPYFTEKQIRTVLEKLVNDNVVMTGNFAKNKTDRTTFYAFVNQQDFLDFTFVEKEVLGALLPFAQKGKSILPEGQNDLTEQAKGLDQKGKSIITDNKPNGKPDSKPLNTGEFSKNENSVFGSETIVKPVAVEENPEPVETPAGEKGKEGEPRGRPADSEKPKKEKVKLTNPALEKCLTGSFLGSNSPSMPLLIIPSTSLFLNPLNFFFKSPAKKRAVSNKASFVGVFP